MIKCHKCKHDNKEGHEFCEECGAKLKWKSICSKCSHELKVGHEFCEECGTPIKDNHHKISHGANFLSRFKWWVVSIVIVLVIISLVIFAIPLPYTVKEGYDEKVPYEADEKYTEKEPYTTNEVYYENQPVSQESCKQTQPMYVSSETERGYDSNDYWYISYDLTNLENQVIVLYIQDAKYKDNQNNILATYNRRSVTLQPSQNKQYTYHSMFSRNEIQSLPQGEFIITQVFAETITKCSTINNIIQVQKSRSVTKYKDVEKARTVTKYKNEYKERFVSRYATLFQRWTGQAKYYYKV